LSPDVKFCRQLPEVAGNCRPGEVVESRGVEPLYPQVPTPARPDGHPAREWPRQHPHQQLSQRVIVLVTLALAVGLWAAALGVLA
jgi:hypothetical protein